ncbi:MAG: hypothetical protein U9Q71_00335 [Pseudomonadota bacterium]|nr:hypothetical protein [Pseudomonadota bacterium]
MTGIISTWRRGGVYDNWPMAERLFDLTSSGSLPEEEAKRVREGLKGRTAVPVPSS